MTTQNPPYFDSVRIEIPLSVMAKILQEKRITASDFRCLDAQSKQEIWNLCLRSCLAECIDLG